MRQQKGIVQKIVKKALRLLLGASLRLTTESYIGRSIDAECYRAVYLRTPGLWARGPSPVHLRAAEIFLSYGCSSVLDAGCGRGELVEVLTARGVRALGCDYINYGPQWPAWRAGRCVVGDIRSL